MARSKAHTRNGPDSKRSANKNRVRNPWTCQREHNPKHLHSPGQGEFPRAAGGNGRTVVLEGQMLPSVTKSALCQAKNTVKMRFWWACSDSNREPTDYESAALTVELQAPVFKFRTRSPALPIPPGNTPGNNSSSEELFAYRYFRSSRKSIPNCWHFL